MKHVYILIFLFSICIRFGYAQTVVAPDCSDAVDNNICTDAAFEIDPNGAGLEELNGNFSNPGTNPGSGNAGCLLTGETNSTWMIVNISGSGLLEFSFGQDGGNGCLDWIMWEYSASACDEIFNNILAPIRCNWNGQCEGFTGVANTLPAGGAASNFEPAINALAGEQYLICLSNYSSQTTTLPLNFFGTADVTCESVLPITVNDATICPGDNAVLTATGAQNYLWTETNETTASITVSPTATTTFSVTGTETLPSGVVAVGIGEGTVTVLDANDPQCSCSVEASNTGPICFNATFGLNATAVTNGTYEWDILGSNIGSGQNLSDLAALAPGTWPIQVSATDENGFVCTDVTQLIILPPTDPLCSCEITASNTGPVCYNATFDLSATAVSNGTYEWEADGVIIGTEQNLTDLSALAPGLWTITVNALDDNGFTCSASTELEVLSETDPNCSCTVTATNTSPICLADFYDLSATSSSNCTYEWSLYGNVIGNGEDMTNQEGIASGVFDFQVTATDINGYTCSSTTTVTVNPLPSISSGIDAQACYLENIDLSATGGVSYNWNDGTQWFNNIINDITFSITENTTFVVEGIDANSCINYDTMTVFLNTALLPVLNNESNTICTGSSVALENLNTNAEATNWYFSNGTEVLGTNNPIPFFFTETGCYDLMVTTTDFNGCDTTMSYDDVVCAEEATAAFYVNPGTIGPGNSEVQFFNTSAGANAFLWDYGDGSISTAVEGLHTFDISLQTGYQVTLIAYSGIGCVDSISIPITYQEELIYYIPNSFTPDADEHNQTFKPIFTSGFDPYNYEINIYNRWGELIWKSFDHTQGWDGTFSSNKGIPVQEGQYSWVIKFKPKDSDGKSVIFGTVNVLK
ncbi:MAG: gliding motility-associated C-terminal domain-containing protein [Crocinitomicaceae bacterium]|nr:gliding motility-associated C-terminal domain-containing protein [Crocinitomicaceae bacterium]